MTQNRIVTIAFGLCFLLALYAAPRAQLTPFPFFIDNTNSNTFFGTYPGNIVVGTAKLNFGLGVNAMSALTTGVDNVALGSNALQNTTTGINNTAIGTDSVIRNVTANNNTGIGFNALAHLASGAAGSNTAVGSQALPTLNEEGAVAVGASALFAATTAYDSVAIGSNALPNISSGNNTIGIGTNTLLNETTDPFNIAMGTDAGYNLSSGTYNLFLGTGFPLIALTTGSYNTFLGSQFTVPATLSNGIVLSDGQGHIRFDYGVTNAAQNTLSGPTVIGGVTFANLPAAPVAGDTAYITDALAANCGDGACTAWATTITGGTGTLKRLAWYNGTNWTLVGK